MAKAPPAFQFYPADFISGTLHLEHKEIACYLLLLCFAWMHKKLPSDETQLAKICRVPPAEFAHIWLRIKDKFVKHKDGGFVNEKMEAVRRNQLAVSSARAEAGRKGGLAKAQAKAKQTPKQKHSKGRLKVEGRRLKSTNQKKVFAPPTLEEVVAYAEGRSSAVDPRKFFEFFTAEEPYWHDSNGKPVRSWKRKFLTWERYADSQPVSAHGRKLSANELAAEEFLQEVHDGNS